MRRKQRQTPTEAALDVLRSTDFVQLASTTPDGAPVLRTMNAVMVRDWILFHGAFAGEKSDCLGRPAVIAAHQVIADIPSYFVDPKKGCPATTYFRSAQAKGTLVNVDDVELKIEMLQALMNKYQPEGGFVPFADDRELYKKDLRSVRVFGLQIDEVTGKASLGQDKPAEFVTKIVEGLWRRGAPNDLKAIEAILAESPAARPLGWKAEGIELRVFQSDDLVKQHAALLEGEYWRTESTLDEMVDAIATSNAWVGAVDSEGRLVGSARAQTDRTWVANIYDVVVHPEWRGRGLGKQLMTILLDHPLVRDCHFQGLGTKDAMDFYEKLGFKSPTAIPRGFASHPMVRIRSGGLPTNAPDS